MKKIYFLKRVLHSIPQAPHKPLTHAPEAAGPSSKSASLRGGSPDGPVPIARPLMRMSKARKKAIPTYPSVWSTAPSLTNTGSSDHCMPAHLTPATMTEEHALSVDTMLLDCVLCRAAAHYPPRGTRAQGDGAGCPSVECADKALVLYKHIHNGSPTHKAQRCSVHEGHGRRRTHRRHLKPQLALGRADEDRGRMQKVVGREYVAGAMQWVRNEDITCCGRTRPPAHCSLQLERAAQKHVCLLLHDAPYSHQPHGAARGVA